MKRYYRWLEDLTDYGKPIIQLSELQLNEIDRWDLSEGKPIKYWDPENTGYYEEDGIAYDLLCTTMQVHVISGRFKQLLETLDLEGGQYLPIRIEREDGGSRLEDYFVLNVDRKIACLDMQKSDYLLWGNERPDRRPDELRDLYHAVLNLSKIGGDRIFRLAEWEPYLVIEEEVKRAITSKGLTGNRYVELEITA